MYTFVDDRGEPLNESAQSFIVVTPVGLSRAALAALSMVRLRASPAWPSKTSTRNWPSTCASPLPAGQSSPSSAPTAPSSRSSAGRNRPALKVKDENSEYVFDKDAIQVGIDTWRNVGMAAGRALFKSPPA